MACGSSFMGSNFPTDCIRKKNIYLTSHVLPLPFSDHDIYYISMKDMTDVFFLLFKIEEVNNKFPLLL